MRTYFQDKIPALIAKVRGLKMRAGLAVKPGTPVEALMK